MSTRKMLFNVSYITCEAFFSPVEENKNYKNSDNEYGGFESFVGGIK